MPRDTNPYGTIFGGVILSYIDQAAFVHALCHGDFTWVTASIERVDFHAPVALGSVVTLHTRTVRAGTTSVTIEVEVFTQRDPAIDPVRVTTATTTLVALGPDGRPTPFADRPA